MTIKCTTSPQLHEVLTFSHVKVVDKHTNSRKNQIINKIHHKQLSISNVISFKEQELHES